MSYLKLFEIISKPWATTNDIKTIAQCGRDNAIRIRNDIQEEIIRKGKKIPYGKSKVVPTKMVTDYIGIDLDYVLTMAKYEKSLNS